jgi:hypothetical protein
VVAQERENETSGQFNEKYSNDLGFTSSWGLTNNLRLCATLNPDFSTIEADVIQLDINKRFELWYPEKRPFFLEGADFFETMIDVVHTRTLADPNFGVKLTGKEGKNTIGLFSTQDAVTSFVMPSLDGSNSDDLDMKSYGTIFRYLRDFGQSSNIGLLLTDREGENYHNRVLGLDGIINFTKKDQLRWQVLGTKTLYPDEISSGYGQPTDEFGGRGISANYSHSISKYNFYGVYQALSPDFRTDLGSVTQTGYRYGEAGGNYIWRAGPGHWFTWINIYSGAAFGKDYNGNTAHKSLRGNLNYNGPLQSYCGVYGQVSRDLYHGEEFKTNYLNYWVGGKPTKWFNFNFWSVFGDQIDYDNTQQGKGLQLGLWTNFNIGRHISVYLDHYYDRMNVNDTRLYIAYREYIKLVYHFNERVFIRTIFQYAIYKKDPALYYDVVEPREQEFLTQILFSYKVNPNTAFYIGYSDNYYGDHDTKIIQTDRNLFAKIGYAWMF